MAQLRSLSPQPWAIAPDRPWRFAALPAAPHMAPAFVAQEVWRHRISAERGEAAKLRVSEAVTNVVKATGRAMGPAIVPVGELVVTAVVRVRPGSERLCLRLWNRAALPARQKRSMIQRASRMCTTSDRDFAGHPAQAASNVGVREGA